MIDTVVFRLYDLKEHAAIVELIKNLRNGQGKIDEFIPKEDVKKDTVHLQRYVDFFKQKTFTWYNAKIHSRSSQRDLTVRIKETLDYIEFNFSLPKYLYGHNVAQFVRDMHSKSFSFSHNSFKENARELYNRLIKEIQYFFITMFDANIADYETGEIDVPLDWSKVEFRRIDLCFNQFFDNETECLKYLDLMKRIKKKGLRETTWQSQYMGGLAYKTDLFYFKIYHKGSEFKKNDSKALERINKLRRKKVYDVEHLQKTANRILRYEMEFKAATLNYIHKKETFRKTCLKWKKSKKLYKALRRKARIRYSKIYETFQAYNEQYYDAPMSLRMTAGFFKMDARIVKNAIREYRENPKAKRQDIDIMLLSKKERIFFKKYEKIISKETRFWLKCPFQADAIYHTRQLAGMSDYLENYKLTSTLLLKCSEYFFRVMKQFQIKELPNQMRLIENLNKLNDKAKKRNDLTKDMRKLLPEKEKHKFRKKTMNTNRMNSYVQLLIDGRDIG